MAFSAFCGKSVEKQDKKISKASPSSEILIKKKINKSLFAFAYFMDKKMHHRCVAIQLIMSGAPGIILPMFSLPLSLPE